MYATRMVNLSLGLTEYRISSGSGELVLSEQDAKRLAALLRDEFKDITFGVTPKEYDLAWNDGKIAAIKAYRERTGTGLAEAKLAVEAAPGIYFKRS
jgi:ribosomal protein L7/L12